MAPNDLLGTVVSRLIARKLDPMNNLKIQDNSPILFNGIIRRIDKVSIRNASYIRQGIVKKWLIIWKRSPKRSFNIPKMIPRNESLKIFKESLETLNFKNLAISKCEMTQKSPSISISVSNRYARMAKMVADAETLSDESQWPDFWQRMFFESMEATGRRSGDQDFRKIFTNDVYVVEILMNLMFYYSNQ